MSARMRQFSMATIQVLILLSRVLFILDARIKYEVNDCIAFVQSNMAEMRTNEKAWRNGQRRQIAEEGPCHCTHHLNLRSRIH